WRTAGAGTPIAPLVSQVAKATRAAGQAVTADAHLSAILNGARGRVTVSRLALAAASGARLSAEGGSGIAYSWPGGGWRVGGIAEVAGGGL
ncbi:hypothetical protein, partial [Bradyrhizobium sp. 25ACV]